MEGRIRQYKDNVVICDPNIQQESTAANALNRISFNMCDLIPSWHFPCSKSIVFDFFFSQFFDTWALILLLSFDDRTCTYIYLHLYQVVVCNELMLSWYLTSSS